MSILNALSRVLGNMSIPIQPSTFNQLFNDLLETYCDTSTSGHPSPLRSRYATRKLFSPILFFFRNPVEDITNASIAPQMIRRCNDALLTTIAALVNANADLGGSRGGEKRRDKGYCRCEQSRGDLLGRRVQIERMHARDTQEVGSSVSRSLRDTVSERLRWI